MSTVARMAQAIAVGPQAQAQARLQPRQRAGQLPALTGLRALAALWVVLYHVTVLTGLGLGPTVGVGFLGVNVFYILSGFVLAYTYLDERGRLRSELRAFYVARVARLYPAYVVALLVALVPFLWVPLAGLHRALMMALTLLGLQAWACPWLPGWNGPAWSVSAEAFFYLCFPLAALGLARIPRRHLISCSYVLWLLALVPPLLYMGLNPDHLARSSAGLPTSQWQTLLHTWPLVRLPEFLLGMTLGRLFLADHPRAGSWCAWATRPVAVGAGIVAVLGFVWLCHLPWPVMLLDDGLLDPLVALLIYALAWGQGPLPALLRSRLALLLGEASYAVYLLHVPVLSILQALVPMPRQVALQAPYVLAYVSLVMALSVLLWQGVEQPYRRAIRAPYT